MKLKTMETDNGFRQDLFDKMCEALEAGEGIWLYCWCIGHTRCAMVEAEYTEKLRAKYGEALTKVRDENSFFDGFVLTR